MRRYRALIVLEPIAEALSEEGIAVMDLNVFLRTNSARSSLSPDFQLCSQGV
jgi:hypothetical protein